MTSPAEEDVAPSEVKALLKVALESAQTRKRANPSAAVRRHDVPVSAGTPPRHLSGRGVARPASNRGDRC